MGFIDKLREWNARNQEKKMMFQQMQEQRRMEQMVEDRMKSANERELEKYLKEQREARIKQQLNSFREKRKKESWRSANMFGGKATMLNQDKQILSGDNQFGWKCNNMKGDSMKFLSGGGWK